MFMLQVVAAAARSSRWWRPPRASSSFRQPQAPASWRSPRAPFVRYDRTTPLLFPSSLWAGYSTYTTVICRKSDREFRGSCFMERIRGSSSHTTSTYHTYAAQATSTAEDCPTGLLQFTYVKMIWSLFAYDNYVTIFSLLPCNAFLLLTQIRCKAWIDHNVSIYSYCYCYLTSISGSIL
jgi:hypothetical protein